MGTEGHTRAASSLPVVGSQGLAIWLKLLVVVGQGHLELVLLLLSLLPGFFALTLLAGQAPVLLLDLLGVVGLSLGVLVLKHGAHAKDGLLLLSEALLLLGLGGGIRVLLTLLLVSPVTLVLSVQSHSLVVHYK